MSHSERLPIAAGVLRRQISAFEETRDSLPPDSHVQALFEITLGHLELCAAHLERSIRGSSPRPDGRVPKLAQGAPQR